MNEALEQRGLDLMADDQAAEVLQPCAQPFDLPATFIAAEFAAILGRWLLSILAMRADQFGALLGEPHSQRIAVGGSVINQSRQLAFENALLQEALDQGDLAGAGRVHRSSQRQAVTGGQGHDLGALSALGVSYAFAPFLALAKVPSAMASDQSIFPCPSSVRRPKAQAA